MNEKDCINYPKIAEAIDYVKTHFKEKINLEEVAEKLHLTQADFQQLFVEWARTNPTQFFQHTSIEYAKKLLKGKQATLFETAENTELSDTNDRHDLFIRIEPMTAAELTNGGENLSINYSYGQSPFGPILVASTTKGICHLAFLEDKNIAIAVLQHRFPNASLKQNSDPIQQNALLIFNYDWQKINPITLHLKGTDFQLKVWTALLKIPKGQLSTYGNIANQIGKPTASRAVGTAIGDNPIAFLIPCHRVIQSSGKMSGYMWGKTRKIAIIGWEASRINIAKTTISINK